MPNPRDKAERVTDGGGNLREGRVIGFSSSVIVVDLEDNCGGPLGLGGILGGISRSTTEACLNTTGADLVCNLKLSIVYYDRT